VALSELGPDCNRIECDAVRQACEEGASADVVLDGSGDVLDVLCYERNRQVVSVPAGTHDEDFVIGNRTVLVLGDAEAGAEVLGDVVIEGNNSVVYGHGPELSLIGGALLIEKNNAIVRGTRIRGDVAITKNNAQLAFCVIEGNLTITGNNTTLAECEIHGDIEIRGLNTVLVQNRFQSASDIEGFNLRCDGNESFSDADGDGQIGEEELAGAIDCADAKGPPRPQSDP
jgi:hypothetical protein